MTNSSPTASSGYFQTDSTRDLDLDGDRLREECGVFGIYGHPNAAAITALGLHALQHRGQEAAGIVSFDGTALPHRAAHGPRRRRLLRAPSVIERLPGSTAIGHVRYSTAGGTILRNVQPMFADLERRRLRASPTTAT